MHSAKSSSTLGHRPERRDPKIMTPMREPLVTLAETFRVGAETDFVSNDVALAVRRGQ